LRGEESSLLHFAICHKQGSTHFSLTHYSKYQVLNTLNEDDGNGLWS